MSVRDFEAFLRQRAVEYDSNIDVNPGSPFDTKVIQPMVRRLGTDPFTQDLSTFIAARMQQAFPDIAGQEEDAVTDLLIKPATLLWDPIVREVNRVKQGLSFSDPTRMTAEEADSLGANFFSTRERGGLARGVGRILFSAPQNIAILPVNFFNSRGGLHFYPTERQSIRATEMLLNITKDDLYYFDVNLVAAAAGTDYNIGIDELISVANVPSAVRVTNTRRFRSGAREEGAQEFVQRTQQELSERSLVTIRGVAAKLVSSFPEVNRLNVIGFNDPEMQRDVIQGGGLGAIVAGGVAGVVVADGEGQNKQRRFFTSEADFVAVVGAAGAVTGYTLTLFEAFGGGDSVRDLPVEKVLSPQELLVSERVLSLGAANVRWTLRKHELTLSGIPGGILFPNTASGELVLKGGEVHIGGMYDTYVRGEGFDEETFTISNVSDDAPLLSGLTATVVTSSDPELAGTKVFSLNSLVEGTDFDAGDSVIEALEAAVRFGYTLQAQDPPEAGVYRILSYYSAPGTPVQLAVTPEPTATTGLATRWRIFDELNVDLLGPRETFISGTDLSCLQNSDIVQVPAGTNFNSLGVAEGHTLEIKVGPTAGTYVITEPPLTPTSVRIDTVLKKTASSLSYSIYRANEGALRPPLVRITKVSLLDSSGQPLGTTIPYSRPVDVQTRAFQNPARGIKWDLVDTFLGLVSAPAPFSIGATALQVRVLGAASPEERTLTLTTTGVAVPLATVIAELNAAFLAQFGIPEAVVAVGADRFGIRPVGTGGVVAVVGGAARTALFGDTQLRTTGDVRSAAITSNGGWDALDPSIDFATGLDVLQVLDGPDIGFYAAPFTAKGTLPGLNSTALLIGALPSGDPVGSIAKTFAPAKQRQVQVGARSLGSARIYFLEPTSFEVDANTRFFLEHEERGVLRFLPDPTLEYQKLPTLPSATPIKDGASTVGGAAFTSASQDFILSGVQEGYRLVITTHPIEGTNVLPDPVPSLAGTTLVFSLAGQTDRTAVFIRDDASLAAGEVSRRGVIEQINRAAGETIAVLTADNRIRFTTHKGLVVRGAGQSTSSSILLGSVSDTGASLTFTGPDDVNNTSPHAGTYAISAVSQTALVVSTTGFGPTAPFISGTVLEQAFSVYRVGVQRISTTGMAENVDASGLHYFDVELISEGAGDLYNIGAQEQLTVSGYRSDGYYLSTDDENLTFSEAERPKLVLSRTILEEGVEDDPSNATQLSGENLEITYERSQLVSDVQGFMSSETERVICANPLSRQLIPYFVRFGASYIGGSKEATVLERLRRHITDLAPVATLDASDIQKIITDEGANYVQNPISMLAVVHRLDRSIWVERSQDRLALNSRLSAFIPEYLNVVRKVT